MPLMLPHAPQFTLFESNITATPSTSAIGTQVNNPAGGANTKDTSWTQLIASTSFDASLVVVWFQGSNAANTDTSTLIDIGIGASSSESVLIPDLLAGQAATAASAIGGRHYIFPLRVPSGSRISARAASVRTSGSVNVLVQLWGGPRNPDAWWCGQTVTAYGINTADSGAVSVTAGNTGTETASPVSIGTTSSHHECLVLGAQGNKGSYTGTIGYHFDVGIDTASTSWLVRDSFYLIHNNAEAIGNGSSAWMPIFAPVPSGSVLVVGGEASGTAETMDFALYGVS
jgi:hypothetical protein